MLLGLKTDVSGTANWFWYRTFLLLERLNFQVSVEIEVMCMDSLEQKRISVVAPAFNEEDSIRAFHSRLLVTVQSLPQYDWQIVYVNDGSRDGTLGVLKNIVEQDQSSSSHTVTVVDLSRNFGKEIAMTAGLDKVDADAVIVIDTDLQDPPELIPQLIEKWEEGYDAVYAKRRERYGE
ncbi:MAG: glycosyltransferase family 2 protein, partial [Pseudomonadales bacterium]|nr:glycosyltransferase family 2 protein [Pseudomonadales bacterium]